MTNRLWKFLAALAAIIILVIGGWYGLPWLQKARADWRLAGANDHIAKANRLISETRLEELSLASFTSLENIQKGGEAAQAALPLLDQAREETEQAEGAVRGARGLSLLPDWYREYLEKKEEIAVLRSQQLSALEQTAQNFLGLYKSGAVIFSVIEEMDGLLGQYQAAEGMIPGSPAAAKIQLDQVAQTIIQVQAQIDAAYSENNFQPLADLSQAMRDYAELVALSAQLADATAAGNQALAQQLAALVENKRLGSGIGRDLLSHWWDKQISPLEQLFTSLQSRQEELDAEAAAVYGQRSS